MQIAKRGADNVRLTVQGKREANACFEIKNKVVDVYTNVFVILLYTGFLDSRIQKCKVHVSSNFVNDDHILCN